MKYACTRALLCMPISKRRCISIYGEKGITLICAIEKIYLFVFVSIREGDPNPLYFYLKTPRYVREVMVLNQLC